MYKSVLLAALLVLGGCEEATFKTTISTSGLGKRYAKNSEEYKIAATAITPFTSTPQSQSAPTQLGGSTTGTFIAAADRIDIRARSASTAVLYLVEWDVTDGKWFVSGAACNVTSVPTVCPRLGKSATTYWHIYKASGTATATYIEAVRNTNGSTISMQDGMSTGASAAVVASAPLDGDGSSGDPLVLNLHSDASLEVSGGLLKVGSLASDAQHGVRGGGTQHANAVAAGAAGFMSGADKTKLDALPASMAAPGAIGGGTPAAITGTVVVAGTRVETPTVGANSSQQHAIPAVASDTMCLIGATQTLVGKTLTDPTVNAGGGTVVLPISASPAQTAEGSASWDSDDDVLTIGTGAGRKTLVNTDSVQTLTNKSISASQINSGTLDIARVPLAGWTAFAVNNAVGISYTASSTTLNSFSNTASASFGTNCAPLYVPISASGFTKIARIDVALENSLTGGGTIRYGLYDGTVTAWVTGAYIDYTAATAVIVTSSPNVSLVTGHYYCFAIQGQAAGGSARLMYFGLQFV